MGEAYTDVFTAVLKMPPSDRVSAMRFGDSIGRIRAIASKELRQLGRDRLTFGMVVGIPLMQILIFGYSINFDVRNIRAGVVDLAQPSASRAFVADLQATQVIRVTEWLRSPQELEASIDSGRLSVGIYIPADFERRRLDAASADTRTRGDTAALT